MKAHLSNAAYGVFDYAAYPIGMLIVAPVVLKNLGVAQYGVWAVAAAAVSAGSIIASGFGDANIQYVAMRRGTGDSDALLRTVRSTMGIHLILGLIIALISWTLAPVLARHVVPSDIGLQFACLWSLRIASLLMLVRAVESVCISTQRAFERYGAAVRISIAARILSLAVAAALTYVNHSVITIMVVAAVINSSGLLAQISQLKKILHTVSLAPIFDREIIAALFGFGIFSWLQALSTVIFAQADRLITGVTLGATVVASYALCVQMAQPIYGIASSGLHFLFPYLSSRHVIASPKTLRKPILLALVVNLLLVAGGTGLVLLFGVPLLRIWGGKDLAESGARVLPLIAISWALSGLSVTAYYAMLGFGRVRAVTGLNLAGGAAMMLSLLWLLPHFGVYGIAASRLFYGLIPLLLYIPLLFVLYPELTHRSRTAKTRSQSQTSGKYLPPDTARPAETAHFRFNFSLNPRRSELAERSTWRSKSGAYANVLGVQVEALDMEQAVVRVDDVLSSGEKGYVCLIGVHGIMEARRHPDVAAAYAESIIAVPDGMPTAWVGRWQGHSTMQRVAGPDLMVEIFRRKEFTGYTHFFYGGKDGVAEELSVRFKQLFPEARIVGTYTPPYRDLTPTEEQEFIKMIQDLKPDIIWVGISTPKQDQFMQRFLPLLETKLMFGVGAAFDFHTGRIRDCAEWIKVAGLQWLHRLIQDPRHLWKRYLRNNPAFMWHITLQLMGLRTYPTTNTETTVVQTTTRMLPESGVLQEKGFDL